MKITETYSSGKTFSTSIPFGRGKDKPAAVLVPITDEPIQVFLIKSGWTGGTPTYHVIIEYGDYEQSDYKFMNADEIAKYFGVDVNLIYETRSFAVTPEYVHAIPNDGELGKRVRQETISPF
jgi:hypothetical protein